MSPARLMHPDSAGSMANAIRVAEAVRDDRSSSGISTTSDLSLRSEPRLLNSAFGRFLKRARARVRAYARVCTRM